MKKSLIVLSLVLVIFAMIGCNASRKNLESVRVSTCVMTWNLNGEDGIIQDSQGFKWYFEDPEDLEAGYIVTVVFDMNGTENIKDDSVISVTFSGAMDPTAEIAYFDGDSCLLSSEMFNIG